VNLLALVMLVSLAQTEVDSTAANGESRPASTNSASRANRFMGALVGGLAGLGATVATFPLTQFCGFPSCPAGTAVFILAPVMMALGSWAGYSLLGGRPGFLSLAAGLIFGLGASSLLTWLGSTIFPEATALDLLPFALAGVALTSAALAGSMLFRDDALEGSSYQAVPLRMAFSAFVTALGLVTSVAIGATLILAGSLPAAVLASSGAAFLTSLAAFGIHRAYGGQGSLGASIVGLLITLAIASTSVFAINGTITNTILGTSGSINAVYAVGLSAAFLPTLLLEMSDARHQLKRMPLTLGAGPMPGGAMARVGFQF
jgi:hypothetical protein